MQQNNYAAAAPRPPHYHYEVVDLMTMVQGTGRDKTKLITFIVNGEPEAQARHRYHVRAKGNNGRPVVYDPSSLQKHDFARAVNDAMEEMGIRRPFFKGDYLDTGVIMEADFFDARPRSHFSANGTLKRKRNPEYPKKKDIDNLEKFAMDALQGVVYSNDNMVRNTVNSKNYADGAPYTKFVFRSYA